MFDHGRVFNTGNDFDSASTRLAGFNINIEHPFQSLHPSHGLMAFLGIFIERVICRLSFLFFSTRRNVNPVLAVRGKYPVKTGQVHSWLGHQGREFSHEIQWLKNDMRSTVSIGCLQFIANLTISGQRQALFANGWATHIATKPFKFISLMGSLITPACKEKPAYLATRLLVFAWSSCSGKVCSVKTLRPC